MQFFYLKNSEGQYLSVISDGERRGELCISLDAARGQESCRVVGIVFLNNSRLLFLHAEYEDIAIKLQNRPFASVMLPFGIESGKSLHTISLYDLQEHSWVCAPPVGQQAEGERVSDSSNVCKFVDAQFNWEEFYLEDIDNDRVPLFIKNFAITFRRSYKDKPTLESVTKILVSNIPNNLKQVVLNALYPSMGVELLDQIAHELKQSDDFRRLFLEVFKNDFWVVNALLPLMEWEKDRQNRPFILCDEKYDVLQKYYKDNEFSSFAHAINCSYRRIISPRKKSCVVTTVRNEGLYILEWIAWYKKLGFEELFIFSNNNDDGSDELLRSLSSAGVITWVKNVIGNDVTPQAKVSKYTYSVLPEILDYKWCLMLDMDEFLSINRSLLNNADDLIEWIDKNEVDVVGFNWQYTSSYESMDVYNRFVTDRVQYYVHDSVIGMANSMIKSMSKPRYVISSTAHHAIWSKRYRATYRLIQGDVHKYNDDPMWSSHGHRAIANIIHYHYKTPLEYLLKLKMYRDSAVQGLHPNTVSIEMFDDGLVYHFNQQHLQYGDRISSNFLFDREELLKIFNELLALPNVDNSYKNVILQTQNKIEDILDFMMKHKEELGSHTKQLLGYIKKIEI